MEAVLVHNGICPCRTTIDSYLFWLFLLQLTSAPASRRLFTLQGRRDGESSIFNFKWALMASGASSPLIQYGLSFCCHTGAFQFPGPKVGVLSGDSFPGFKWKNGSWSLTHLPVLWDSRTSFFIQHEAIFKPREEEEEEEEEGQHRLLVSHSLV